MKLPLYNLQGEKTGETQLPDTIFGVPLNSDLVYQVAVSQMANRRQVSANTKGRGEVRGGGRKPWRQKHTGRARHGSIRSPIWKGGGVAGGPTKERVFKKKINKKMRRKALAMVLSEKARKNQLVILDSFSLESPKTAVMKKILRQFPFRDTSILFVSPTRDKNLILAARNLPRVKIIEVRNLNPLDVLSSAYLVMPKDAIGVLEHIFEGKAKTKSYHMV